ncbi:MAG: general stress protein [Bacteriovorax sp.]
MEHQKSAHTEIVAIFKDQAVVKKTIEELKDQDFKADDMSVHMHKKGDVEKFTKETGVHAADSAFFLSIHADGMREQLIAKNIMVKNGALNIYNPAELDSSKVH